MVKIYTLEITTTDGTKSSLNYFSEKCLAQDARELATCEDVIALYEFTPDGATCDWLA